MAANLQRLKEKIIRGRPAYPCKYSGNIMGLDNNGYYDVILGADTKIHVLRDKLIFFRRTDTEEKSTDQRNEEMITHDPLTGLAMLKGDPIMIEIKNYKCRKLKRMNLPEQILFEGKNGGFSLTLSPSSLHTLFEFIKIELPDLVAEGIAGGGVRKYKRRKYTKRRKSKKRKSKRKSLKKKSRKR